ncbi:MAG TPA: efflux RND transporter periplasmic adaptor subunit [Bacteroidales bacterium]|nr:efflux RND transporter periplasmic adaptor subunit [Bacteroidales bacterium]
MKKKRIMIVGAIALVLIAVMVLSRSCKGKEQKVTLDTVMVKKGSVSNVVTATGTIEAIKTVEVGTQVSGEIRKIYVDYNSQVKAGQLLAELDRKPLTTALTIAEASLDNSKAEMTYQTSNFNRVKALYDKKLVAESDFDQTRYDHERAVANLKTAQLNYDKAKINLEYAYIYSPIDGVVLSRAVDEGQTVAASFNTPTLFSIANDLTRMQVEASIDEADIGQVKNNQRVDFTVDAYPGQNFKGTVTQIRLQPVTTSNVVTYTVIVEAPNPDKKLMPGMTASITIVTEEANDVLTVASKALRFKPTPDQLAAYMKSIGVAVPEQKEEAKAAPQMAAMNAKGGMPMGPVSAGNEVWVKRGNNIQPVKVETGINNDLDVQIISGLNDGDEVVVGINTGFDAAAFKNGPTSSPFMPKPPARTSSSAAKRQ